MGELLNGSCLGCGSDISQPRLRRKALYCSNPCRTKATQRASHEAFPQRGLLPNSTLGAISEMLVAADLLRRGYAVFRAVSPACSCDLAVLREGVLARIEVRTGARHPKTGRLVHSWKESDEGRSDILAVVVYGAEIVYSPALDAAGATEGRGEGGEAD